MLVLALSLTAFHVNSKTRSSSSPLSLFVKIRFYFSRFCCLGSKKVIISNEEPRSEGPHDPKTKRSRETLCVVS